MSLTKFNTRIGNNLLEVVSSLEELKSLKHFNHAVLVLGATTTQDGDGGIYSWDGSNEQTPDDISLIQSDHNTIGRWKRLSYALNAAEDAPLSFSGETSRTVAFVQGNYSFSMASRFTITATSNVSWLTIGSISKNNLSQTINYEVIGNPNNSVREGVITVTNGFQTFTYVVTQGEVESVTVSSSLVFNNEARDNNITNVVSNASWTATSSVSWISLSSSSGTGNGSIQFDLEENTDQQNDRSGNITVTTASGYSQVISVTQSQGASEIESVDEQVIDSDAATGLSFEIDSDIGWTATTSTSWITLTTSSGNDGDDVVYSVTENTDIVNDRTGTIIVSSTNGQNVVTVDIRQTEVADAFQVKIDTTNTTLNNFAVERARNISVDWGDGSTKESTPDNISFNRLTHTYATDGVYTVSITQNDKNVVAQKFSTVGFPYYSEHHSYALDTALTNDASNVGGADIYSMETSQGSCDFSFNFPSGVGGSQTSNEDGISINSDQHPVKMIEEIVEWGNMTIDSLDKFLSYASNLTTISTELTNFDMSNVKSLSNSFLSCTGLTSFPTHANGFDTSGVYGLYQTWYNCSGLTSFPLIDTSNVEIFDRTWRSCTGLTSFPLINTEMGLGFAYAWGGCSGLTSFPSINTSKALNLYQTWSDCSGLTSFPTPDAATGALDTSKVYNMFATWNRCSGLTSFPAIDLTTMNDTSTVHPTVAEEMTYPALSIDSVNRGTISLSNNTLSSTWSDCSGLTSFPLIDTSGITAMDRTWNDCSGLTSFPSIDTSSVTSMTGCWQNCRQLTSFPSIDTSNVESLDSTWEDCRQLTSFPSIDTSNVESLDSTWKDCSDLTSFPAIDVVKCENFNETWRNCTGFTAASNFGKFTNTSYTTAGETYRGIAVSGSSWYKTWEGCTMAFTSKVNSPFDNLTAGTTIKVRLRRPTYVISSTSAVARQFIEAQSFDTPLPTGSIYYPPFDISALTSVTINDSSTTISTSNGSFELTGWDQMTFPLVDAHFGLGSTYTYGDATRPSLLTEINLNIGLPSSDITTILSEIYTGSVQGIHTPITGTSSYTWNSLTAIQSTGASTTYVAHLLDKGWDITSNGTLQLGSAIQLGARIVEPMYNVSHYRPMWYMNYGTDTTLNSNGTRLAISATEDEALNQIPISQADSNIRGYIEIHDWDANNNAWNKIDTINMTDLVENNAYSGSGGSVHRMGQSIEFDESGNRIVIGTPGFVGSSTATDGSENAGGRVDVFEYDPDSPSKGYVQLGGVIYGETLGDDFGSSVSISNDGTIIAASAPLADGDESGTEPSRGEIRVFELDTSGATPIWTKLGNTILGEESGAFGGGGLIYSSDVPGVTTNPTDTYNDYEFIGDAIKLSGNGHRIVIGSPLSSNNGQSTSTGAAEIYTYDSTQNPAWSKLGDTLRGHVAGANFGTAVSMNDAGDRVIVGSPFLNNPTYGSSVDARVSIFEYVVSEYVQAWRQVGSVIKDLNSGPSGTEALWFGAQVSMSADGDRIAIGSPGSYDGSKPYRGTVQVRELDKSTYTGLAPYNSSTSTGISGDFNLISEPISDILHTSNTTQYYYEWFGTDVVISSDGSKIIASNSNANGYMGSVHNNVYAFQTYASVFQL
jgi:hypothetical protein